MCVCFPKLKSQKIYCALEWTLGIHFVKTSKLGNIFYVILNIFLCFGLGFTFCLQIFQRHIRRFYFACAALLRCGEPLTEHLAPLILSDMLWGPQIITVCSRCGEHAVTSELSESPSLLLSAYRLETLQSSSKNSLKSPNCARLPFATHCTWNFLRLLSTFITNFSSSTHYIDLLA